MVKKIVGIATVAHSDHIDYALPEINQWNLKAIKIGVLDGLTSNEIMDLAGKAGEAVLALKLRDGTYVKAAANRVMPRMQACIDSLNKSNVDFILVMGMGKFPRLKSNKLLIQPGMFFKEIVLGAVGPKGKLGIMCYVEEQAARAKENFDKIISAKGWGTDVHIVAGAPYGPNAQEEVARASEKLKKYDVQLVGCHGPGYTPEMKKTIESITGKPTLLGRSAITYIIKALAD